MSLVMPEVVSSTLSKVMELIHFYFGGTEYFIGQKASSYLLIVIAVLPAMLVESITALKKKETVVYIAPYFHNSVLIF